MNKAKLLRINYQDKPEIITNELLRVNKNSIPIIIVKQVINITHIYLF